MNNYNGHQSLPPPPTPRSRDLLDSVEERERFVDRVLDLMQLAETSLLTHENLQAVPEAIRAIFAVKAMAAFLNHAAITAEASTILERSERMGTPGDSDRGWLLVAIDRLRLLAVDPHHSSTPKTLLIPVAMAHIDRLNTLVIDLATRGAPHPDPHIAALLAEVCGATKLLLRTPVASLFTRLQAHALRSSHVLSTRGDDGTIPIEQHALLEKILPPILTAATHEAACATQLTLLFVDQKTEFIVRLACDCTVTIPAAITRTLGTAGSLTQDDGIVTIRLPF